MPRADLSWWRASARRRRDPRPRHHKILACYAVNPGVPTGLAEQVFAHLTKPDLVIFLRIGAREALRRKGAFTSLETGHSGDGEADFVSYQDTVLAQLHEQEQRGGWLSMDVTDIDQHAVFKVAADVLADRLQLTT